MSCLSNIYTCMLYSEPVQYGLRRDLPSFQVKSRQDQGDRVTGWHGHTEYRYSVSVLL